MTEFGCASLGFTRSVLRTFTDSGTASEIFTTDDVVATLNPSLVSSKTDATTTASSSSTSQTSGSASASATSKPKKSNIGAIVGGVVGGLVALGALAFGAIFLILRSRKNKTNNANAHNGANTPMIGGAQMGQGPAPGVTEYKPQPGGFPPQGEQYPPAAGGYYQQDLKPGFQQNGVPGQEMGMHNNPYSPPGSPAPQYPGPAMQNLGAVPAGVAEAGGTPVQNPNAAATPPPHPQPHPQPHPNQQNIYEAP